MSETTARTLTTLRYPTEGWIHFDGSPVSELTLYSGPGWWRLVVTLSGESLCAADHCLCEADRHTIQCAATAYRARPVAPPPAQRTIKWFEGIEAEAARLAEFFEEAPDA